MNVLGFSLCISAFVHLSFTSLVFSFLTVVAVTLLASIVRQGFIYLVYVHRLTPIESSMRSFDTVLAYLGGVDS